MCRASGLSAESLELLDQVVEQVGAIDRLLQRKREIVEIIGDNHDEPIELLRLNLESIERSTNALRSRLAELLSQSHNSYNRPI